MFEQRLKEMMAANGSSHELFEIWDNGSETYGFIDDEGLHHFSTEKQRNLALQQ